MTRKIRECGDSEFKLHCKEDKRMYKQNVFVENVRKKRKGQSTVEYIVLVTAVVGALIVFLGSKGGFEGAFSGILNQGTNSMETMSDRISNSYN